MKKLVVVVAVISLLAIGALAYAQMGGGMMGDKSEMGSGMMGDQAQQKTGEATYKSGYYPCPHMMGQGMMGQGMGMMGSGMMGSGYGGHMMGQGMMGMMSSGDAESYKGFLDDTVDLRKKLHNKKFDYFEATRNSDTKPETITKLKKEIREIQIKIFEKAPL